VLEDQQFASFLHVAKVIKLTFRHRFWDNWHSLLAKIDDGKLLGNDSSSKIL